MNTSYSKNFKLRLIIIVMFVFGVLSFNYFYKPSTRVVSIKNISGIPLQLSIPSINMDTNIEEVSLGTNGVMQAPKQNLNTGWNKSGIKPGEEGTALISGYVFWEYGHTAKFSELYSLKPEDILEVTNDRGEIIIFKISKIRNYDLDYDISEVYKSNDGKSHLNLITYDGSWDKESESYSRRIVVFADKESTTTLSQRLIEKENLKQEIITTKLFENLNIVDEKALIASFY